MNFLIRLHGGVNVQEGFALSEPGLPSPQSSGSWGGAPPSVQCATASVNQAGTSISLDLLVTENSSNCMLIILFNPWILRKYRSWE